PGPARSGIAFAVDALAVRHVPEAVVVAELGIEPRCDLREPVPRPGRTGGTPVGVPIGPVVALDDPHGDKVAVDRDAEVGAKALRARIRFSRPRQPSCGSSDGKRRTARSTRSPRSHSYSKSQSPESSTSSTVKATMLP